MGGSTGLAGASGMRFRRGAGRTRARREAETGLTVLLERWLNVLFFKAIPISQHGQDIHCQGRTAISPHKGTEYK
jgi:hypothetical protein